MNADRYRELVAFAVDGILMGSHEGIITEANECMCSMIGMPREEIIGKHISTLPFSQDSINKTPFRFDLLKKGEIVVNERIFIRPDNSEIVIEMHTKMMPDSSYHSIYRDITEHKKTEETLRESEKKYRKVYEFSKLLQDTSPAFIVAIDVSGKTLMMNPALLDALEYNADEIKGTDYITTFVPEEDRESLSVIFQQIIKEEKATINENRIKSRNGRIFLVEWHGKITNRQGNEDDFFVGIGIDITNRKKMEEELQKTQKLESLGVLAGGIAHDFNNLLGGIFGFIELAKKQSTELEVREYLTKSLNTIDRARGLTQQLLTFSKGGDPVRKADFLFPFLKDTTQFALSGSSVSCHFDYPEDLWSCIFDRNQIGQVIDNIVINAQQAMPVGGTIEFCARNVTIIKKQHPILSQGNYVKISIKDSGIGIPKELLTSIFDPFFTTKTKGHGLGLATCYSIIKKHSGFIDVESEAGKGATFHVYIPASVEPVLTSTEEVVRKHKGGGTILVMDDEEIIRDIVKNILVSLGYKVICTANGKDTLDFFTAEIDAKRKIEAIILDLTIPGEMGGKETVNKIRELDTETPIFVVSGYADDPVMANPSKYGFTASICKPFEIADLSKMLNDYLK